MKYFLVKTDPDSYSIGNFIKDKKTIWDGVRNAEAIKTIRSMQVGDRVLVYHTQGQNSIRGITKVTSAPTPDKKLPSSWVVELELLEAFKPPFITLEKIKLSGLFGSTPIVRQPRLSVISLPDSFIKWLRAKPNL